MRSFLLLAGMIGASIWTVPYASVAYADDNLIEAVPLFELQGPSGQPFKNPSDVHVNQDGEIFVLDGVNKRVAIFAKNGEWKREILKESFEKPTGLFVSDNGTLFVANGMRGSIEILDMEGNDKGLVVMPKNGKDKADPVDVVYDGQARALYVADNDNHRIGKYDLKTFKWQFVGSVGDGQNHLRFPFLMAAAPGSSFAVVDVINARVKLYDSKLSIQKIVSGWGVQPGQVYRPKGVAVDAKGRIFISDSYMEVVQVFSKDGAYLGVIADKKGIKKFVTPVGIFVDSLNRLHVVEMLANRVAVLNLRF